MNSDTPNLDPYVSPASGGSGAAMGLKTVASRQRFWLVFLLFLHTVNTYMDRVCISAAKGSMQKDISGLDDQMMGYVFGIFAIGYALFQIPAGWFSDKAGPRKALTIVVIIWSIFTALSGAVYTAISLLVVRFLFGVGEAGAYPGATRALYSWLPAKERGIGQGIFHSGARVGAALSLLVMPWVIDMIGWRMTFVANAVIGLVWGAVWWVWYRNEPSEHSKVNELELHLIREGLEEEARTETKVPYIQVVTSANVLLAMFQYAASNITFFISITWLQPYLRKTWGDEYGYLASLPLLCGAVALWISGYAVTFLHKRGMPVISRRLPAMIGYSLGAIGLLLCTQTAESNSVWVFIGCFSLATFGVEMTLSPSWAFCMDIGGSRSGAVSAAMNMVGNMGAAVSAVAFPYFVANVTIPLIAEKTGTANSFFAFAALMNVLAVVAWMFMNPRREVKELSEKDLHNRLALFVALIVFVIAALVYTKFLMPKAEPKKEDSKAAAVLRLMDGSDEQFVSNRKLTTDKPKETAFPVCDSSVFSVLSVAKTQALSVSDIRTKKPRQSSVFGFASNRKLTTDDTESTDKPEKAMFPVCDSSVSSLVKPRALSVSDIRTKKPRQSSIFGFASNRKLTTDDTESTDKPEKAMFPVCDSSVLSVLSVVKNRALSGADSSPKKPWQSSVFGFASNRKLTTDDTESTDKTEKAVSPVCDSSVFSVFSVFSVLSVVKNRALNVPALVTTGKASHEAA